VKPLIIGHRGASALAPENTLVAFERALDAGADGLEFDVHLAADGVPIVIHDDTLKRTGQRPGLVADFTSKELTQVDAGSWFNRKVPALADASFTHARIPTVAQLFALVKSRRPILYVELKGVKARDLAAPVAALIAKFNFKAQVVVESFDHAAITESKRVDPTIRTAALFERTLKHPRPSARWLLGRAAVAGADEIALHYSMAGRREVEHLNKEGYPVVIWTADNPIWVKRACLYGIHAIITNNPAVLLSVRSDLATEVTENTE
jgi:glycerophosphoryl diester phosphodiesterase